MMIWIEGDDWDRLICNCFQSLFSVVTSKEESRQQQLQLNRSQRR